MTAMRVRVATDALPIWGTSTTFSSANSACWISGSRSNTSRAAPAIQPSEGLVRAPPHPPLHRVLY